MASTPVTVAEATDRERAQHYRSHLANKCLNQRELAQWQVILTDISTQIVNNY